MKRARTVASAGPRHNCRSLPLLDHAHRYFRIDEAVAVELAVAAPDQVLELATERMATLERAEEPGAAREERARGNQHAAAEQVGRVASRGAVGPELIRFIPIDSEGKQIAARERSGQEREVE